MKKVLFIFGMLLTGTTSIFSQIGNEEKLGLKPFDASKVAFAKGDVDCRCSKNILSDGGFQNLTESGSNITTLSSHWKPGFNTPQWSPSIQSPCEKGVVSMWGNKTVGESIYQNGIPFVAGKIYNVKITARFANPTSLSTFVRLKLFTYPGTGAPTSYDGPVAPSVPPNDGNSSANISSLAWNTYTFQFKATNGNNNIALHPENDYFQNNGSYVSWIQIDNICIEDACKIPDDACNPSFKSSTFTVNAQGNVVMDVNPAITSDAEHYWGLIAVSNPADLTPIPLATITSGGTFGLHISSTGVATPIGMGTGITGSTSHFGYHYEGVDVGRCVKITHYIKCCNKWYSITKTYCTHLCVDEQTGKVTDANPKDIKALEAQAVKGRG